MATAQHTISRGGEEIDGERFYVCLSRYTSSSITAYLASHSVNLIVFNFNLIFFISVQGKVLALGSDIGY